ncbi:toprim domain-containing protein [Rickettsiales endosymbiont of Stachyamoeba lipophora]|uniref:toprim domain-containing protein n=1 Tax=Rickettsiales endosymbiont of Stachyamoeba lipophora TaxID=2486578 RepID=UPI000F64D26F|nr:toprim domain-containing protein [Rickettsiales endosymbiont of Stachyamoeba lipophora]AZL15272.1 toprim domain-containing protein [Rickettsiales endosymbiont of Stachyamoeba lipophora]
MYRFSNNNLLIPIYDINGKLWNLQTIFPNGNKRFLRGGRKKGCFTIIGNNFAESKIALLAEGFATAASIHLATKMPCIVAFDAGNLEPVLQVIYSHYPNKKYIICADNDMYGKQNTGVISALKAARICNTKVIVPSFQDTVTKPTDFNDLHILEGLGALRKQLFEEICNAI